MNTDNKHSEKILGVDLGSQYIKIALMENGSVTSTETIETIAFYKRYGRQSDEGFRIDLSAPGFADADMIVAAGYGSMAASVDGAENISEISAHYLGAV